MSRLRRWAIDLLQRVLVWLGGEAERVEFPTSEPDAPVKPSAKPETSLRRKAGAYVRAAEETHAGKDGEFKRHQVYAQLLKDYPPKKSGDRVRLSRAIDDAVEQL